MLITGYVLPCGLRYSELGDQTKTNMDMTAINNNTSDYLGLDQHTQFELEIFESKDGSSLFQLCNLTRTKGGEAVLKRRMQRPWAKASRILKTQGSIAYIIKNRDLFKTFDPGNLKYVAGNIELYKSAALPIIVTKNFFGFTYQAIALYATETNHFLSIARGVQLTCRLIKSLHLFLEKIETTSVPDELKQLLDKANELLASGLIAAIDQKNPEFKFWKFWHIFQLDQFFRVQEVDKITRLLSIIYEIDALIALADCTKNNNFLLPSVEEGEMKVYAEGLGHPFLTDAVTNPVTLEQRGRGVFLTGPNMAGKTTYLRAFATALYLAHLGMGVPATHFQFTPIEQLISSISLSDNLHHGVSYFRAEALRVKDVAKAINAGFRVVAIMDEPFKGTNVKDTLEASLEILTRFSTMENLLFMFSSHQIELAGQIQGPIDFKCFAAIETEDRLRFDYRLKTGVTTQRIGMRVLREEGVFELLDDG